MKKISLLAIIIILGLSSCKKDIHCNCKVTTTQNGVDTVTYEYVTVKNSTIRQAAKRECSSYSIKSEAGPNQTNKNVDCLLK